MGMGRCSRCGREVEVEYASDGQAYCSACAFYGMNRQCFRCRMYVPSTELQQYRGQWMCPYCLMDMRDEDRRLEEQGSAREKEGAGYVSSETCERCGRQITTAYYYGGRRLCANCYEDMKREWKEVGGEKPPMPMYRVTEERVREKGKMSFIERLFAELLGRLGIRQGKKGQSEIVAMQKPMRKVAAQSSGAGEKAMWNQTGKEGEPARPPMIEGPEKKTKKKRGRKSQDVSFPQDFSTDREGEAQPGRKKKGKKGSAFEDFKEE